MSRQKRRAFQQSIAPTLPRLFRLAYRLTGSVPDAEDLVQDTCVAACERLEGLTDIEHPDRWLLRVLHNRFIDGARRQSRAPVVNLHDVAPLVVVDALAEERHGDIAELTERERAFLAACAKLSDQHRMMLSLRAEGYALPEIAGIMDIDNSVLRGRLHRARQSLAQHLAEELATDAPQARHRSQS
jgi:RNA polymerase sigma-70 factor (ECF subfamily)